MKEIFDKYKELSIKYKELCFKVKEGNFFVIGILTNNGPLLYKFDIKYYNEFNVLELDTLNDFNSFEASSINRLNNTSFDNVSYFVTNDNKLLKYYGNSPIVNIPDNINTICHNAFKDNNYIEIVNGKNVKDVEHYAFRNNSNLSTLNFPNLIWLGNVLNVPNLKHYTISDKLYGFINEDNNYDNSTVTVNGTTYYFDNSIEKEFMDEAEVIKTNPKEQIQLIKIKNDERKFRTVNDENRNMTITAISHIDKKFNDLPESIKDIFYKTNHVIYVVDSLPDAGQYYVGENIILIHRTQVDYAFYHEIGHMIDEYLDNISSKYNFKKLYYMELYNLYRNNSKTHLMSKDCLNHLISNEQEYFAEAVKRYLTNDEDFRVECPNTYEFIKNTIENLNKDKPTILKLK